MNDETTRRRWVTLCGVGAVTGLAGCMGGDDTVTDGASNGDENGTDDQATSGDSVVNWEQSYVAEMDLHKAGTPDITQTVHEGDVHIYTVLGDGEELESYRVDGETYSIVSGNCFLDSEPAAETSVPDVQEPMDDGLDESELETTTIDGESVYILEPSDPEHEDARWYGSTDTGHPVQFESSIVTVTFHSWGATDPITPPDMECMDI